jgi:glycosyltransferase involved in cell wall biosynthesis
MSLVTSKKPFFSIVIPTRDRAFLREGLITSIIKQDFQDFEIIIADNSTDDLSQLFLNDLKDHLCIKNIRTGGLNMADNWNLAINNASGKYLLLFSDKMILKQGSLKFLKDFINKNNPDCVTWNIDYLVDKDLTFIDNSLKLNNTTISSQELFESILKSDMFAFDNSAFHCNSAISLEVIESIKSKTGRVCMQLNPDYTLSYQVLMNIDKIHLIGNSLSVLRYQDHDNGYGNGSSFMKKTSQAKIFMKDNDDWVKKMEKFKDLPINGNHFILDLILKDLYFIMRLYDVNPDNIIPRSIRTSYYYFKTQNEIFWRISMGIDMKRELDLWKLSLKSESKEIRKLTEKLSKKMIFKKYNILLIQFCKKSSFISPFLNFIKTRINSKKGIKYMSIDDFYNNEIIK